MPLRLNTKKRSNASKKKEYLEILEQNLNEQSLKILAEKSKLPGINFLIKNNQNLL